MPSAEEYERFFIDADTDKSGTLTLEELISVLRRKGYKGSNSELAITLANMVVAKFELNYNSEVDISNVKFFAETDTSGDGLISKDEYMVAMGQQAPEEHGKASMRCCFVSFDKDGNGTIDASELDSLFKEMGKHFTPKEIKRMMGMMDKNQSGVIEYEEFIEFFFNKK